MNKILPIGTILYLKEGTTKIMILNRGVTVTQDNQEVLFDYSAAIYPMGLNPEQLFYFNQEDIDKVVFEGYHDEEEERFVQLYQDWYLKQKEILPKGKTSR
ncbi:DUF4176 domain-containing protein [Streptococcus oricebi]|uniref:Type II secretion protein n=1 Tax=Streptococcus oricebi TaxID=1547447 RepID=A0ABS5B3P4_9STRE|nr:DUF4176 domain-containing protein [Streptococcus oricebi]MBP2623452.1 type II secretion protein [Streptococcus oricebi]